MKKIVSIALAILLVVGCITAAGCTSTVLDPSSAIVGTWSGEKTIPLVGTAELSANFATDKSADVTLKLSSTLIGDISKTFDATWSHVSGNGFQGTMFGYSFDITVNDTIMEVTLNPYRMGIIEDEIADMNFSFTLSKKN